MNIRRYAALFMDDFKPETVNQSLRDAHLDYVLSNHDRITDAGGLRPEAGAPFCGSLWVIAASTREEAQAIADADPFCVAQVRARPRVFFWGRAPFPEPAKGRDT